MNEVKGAVSVERYGLGVILVTMSAFAWSTAGIFSKGVSADVWQIQFWRGLFSAIFILIYVVWRERGRTPRLFRSLGWPGWAAAAISSGATIAFIPAFKLTSIANVTVIYATAPFVAAAFAWLWMRERASRHTLIASAVSLVGVTVIIGGSLGKPNILGDCLALVMTAGMAMLMVLIRRYPKSPMVPAACVSSVQLLLVGLALSQPFGIPEHEIMILIGFGLMQALAIVTLTEGARLIPASHSALLGGLEIPLAPIWAWLILQEIPPNLTFIGGGVIVAGVGWHMFQERQVRDA